MRKRERFVKDDSWDFVVVGVEFVVDGWKGAEFEAGDESQDGGAAGGDTVLDDESGEFGEEAVDLGGGREVGGFATKGGGKVSVDELGVETAGVAEAESGVLQDGVVAAATGASAMMTGVDGKELRVRYFHFSPRFGEGKGYTLRCFCKSLERIDGTIVRAGIVISICEKRLGEVGSKGVRGNEWRVDG